jgi:hypothetical protein
MKKLLIAVGVIVLLAGLGLFAAGAAHLGDAPAKLTWTTPEFRSALMTFAYKVYGNPKMEYGRHYLSKITFKNSGQRPITDFAISYKLQDYIPWTDPETMPDIPPGFSFAKLYYPRLPADVTKLHTASTCELQAKVQWKEDGKPHEQTFKHDVLLRSVNELTYCDLPSSEVESWFDAFDTSDFAVAMVTPNDPVVAAYASQISKMAGGTMAGIGGGPKEIARLCGEIYDYMCKTGLRYTGDTGVPADFDDVKTLSQVVRLPRDVILNDNGLCIELAILWASILKHFGVDAALVMVPSHCYVIAYSPQQGLPLDDGYPIECTSITPAAVGADKPVSFEESNKMAVDETKKHYEDGRIIILPVADYQQMGFTPPELPDVDVTKITETLEKRLPTASAAVVQNTPQQQEQQMNQPDNGGGNVPDQPPPPSQTLPNSNSGGIVWQHPQGYVSINFPQGFVSINPQVNPGNVLLLVAGDPRTGLDCNVMEVTGTQNPVTAWGYINKSCARNGIRLKVQGYKNGDNGMVFFSGTTTYTKTGLLTQWVCAAKPFPNAVVFVSAGTPQLAWNSQYSNVINLMNNVHFR